MKKKKEQPLIYWTILKSLISQLTIVITLIYNDTFDWVARYQGSIFSFFSGHAF